MLYTSDFKWGLKRNYVKNYFLYPVMLLVLMSFSYPHNEPDIILHNKTTATPYTLIRAESYNALSGVATENCSDIGGGLDVGFTDAGDYLEYNNVDFGTGALSLDMRIASLATFTGTAEFHLGSVTGTLIATVPFGSTGGWQNWVTKTVPVAGASGIQNLYIVFQGGASIGNVNWFQFNADPISTPAAPTGLTATGGNTTVGLNWTLSQSATTYNIKRATVSGGPYTTVQTGVTGTFYADGGLTNGITYYYVVSAVNTAGESANSIEMSAVPQVLINVACVGNSITAGAGVADSATQSYPAQLRVLLGAGYLTTNFGFSGATMAKNGDNPYWATGRYTAAIGYNPNIVIILLGTNDSKAWNWAVSAGEFVADYESMINVFKSLPSNPKIFIGINTKAFSTAYGIDESVLANYIRPDEVQIAKTMGVSIIDVHDSTLNDGALFADGIHPGIAGSGVLAAKVKELITDPTPQITQAANMLSAPAATAYQWYLNGDTVAAVNGGTNKILAVTVPGTYAVGVKLNNTNQDRLMSDDVVINTTNFPPAAPTGFIAATGNTSVALSWTASAGATSYSVERATVSGGPYTIVQSGITATSYTDTGLTNDTTYYYVVTATNTNGVSANSIQQSATPLPLSIQGSHVDADCANGDGSITITGVSGTGTPPYSYSFNSGPFSSTNVFSGLSSGSYLVSVRDASTPTATQVDTTIIISGTILSVNNDTTVCQGSPVSLSVSGGSNYIWTATPADTSLKTPNIANPVVKPSATTLYTVTSGIPASSNLIVNPGFESGNTGFTSQYNYTTSPSFSAGSYSINTNPSNQNSFFTTCGDHTTGSGNMLVTDGSTTGILQLWDENITVVPHTVYTFSYWIQDLSNAVNGDGNPAGLNTLVNGNSIGIAASPVFGLPCGQWVQKSFTWNSGASTSADISIIDTTIEANGNDFALDDISFSTSGCSTSKSITVTVNPDTTAPASSPVTYCQNSITVPLSATGSNLLWYTSPGGGTGSAIAPTPSASIIGTIIYYVSQTGTSCESARTPVGVTVIANPVVNAGADTTIFFGETVVLNGSTNAVNGIYLWAPSGSSTISTQVSPQVKTTYTLQVTDAGCSSTDTVTVNVEPDECISLMRIFTPNKDGINDLWKIYSSNCYKVVMVDVYNSWGSRVYHSDNYANDWDGTYNGDPVPDATYYYVIQLTKNSGQTSTITGNVTIIR